MEIIKLSDQTPINDAQEGIKNYIGDLITNDYLKLNNKAIPDRQPIPKVQDIQTVQGGKQWFSTLDMSKVYYQGHVHPDSRKYTAIFYPWSLYKQIRIPFGLKNAPLCFQRYVNETLEGLRGLKYIAYLDEILVYFNKAFDEQLENLQTVLMKQKSKEIKL